MTQQQMPASSNDHDVFLKKKKIDYFMPYKNKENYARCMRGKS